MTKQSGLQYADILVFCILSSSPLFPSSSQPHPLPPPPSPSPPSSTLPHSIHHLKRSGATLHAGTVVANLELDDPSKVRQSEKYLKTLPCNSTEVAHGNKPHQIYQQSDKALRDILAGFVLPEPYQTQRVSSRTGNCVQLYVRTYS